MLITCNVCGRRYTLEAFSTLSFVGMQHGADMTLEMRNCPCGTTLSIDVDGVVEPEVTPDVIDAEFEWDN